MGVNETQGGPVLGVQVITIDDLEENGGVYLLQGNQALPVEGLESTDRSIIGGNAIPVYIVSQAEIDKGRFLVLQQNAVPVGTLADLNVVRTLRGRVALPVFAVNGWTG